MHEENLKCLNESLKEEELTNFENDLLNISEKYGIDGFNRVIASKKNYKYTQILSHIRGNCIEWVNMNSECKILELGSGYGSITGTLAKKAKKVVSFDVSWNKCYINSKINKDYNNISYVAGSFDELKNYLDGEKFDYITLIGSFDFAGQFINTSNCHEELLNEIFKMLTDDGKLIIAIENKYGLKYWSGSTEIRSGMQFENITGYKNMTGVRTFSKKHLEELLNKCNYKDLRFYYPYPDYEFAMSIYSDKHLPSEDCFTGEKYNWQANRTELFEEYKAFQEISKDGYFTQYSNSYLIFAGKKENKSHMEDNFETTFVKYSNERAKTFAIRTEIKENENREKKVIKYKLNKACNSHMNKINEFKNKLERQYSKTRFNLTNGKQIPEGFEFEYAKGHPYIDELLECCNNNEYDKFIDKIKNFFNEVINANDDMYFSISPQFKEVFGNVKLDGNLRCGLISNIDLIFQNVIVGNKGEWNIIDYEWLFKFPIPVKYILFRSIYYFFRGGNSGQLKFNPEWEKKCYELADISDSLYKTFFRMEVNYQKYVLGQLVPIRNLPANNYHSIVGRSACIFVDSGNGFNKDEMYITPEKALNNGRLEFTYKVPQNVNKIRIDPVERKCMIYLLKLTDENGDTIKYKTNGKKVKNNLYIFRNRDPQIIIKNANKLKIINVILEVMVFTPVINKKI